MAARSDIAVTRRGLGFLAGGGAGRITGFVFVLFRLVGGMSAWGPWLRGCKVVWMRKAGGRCKLLEGFGERGCCALMGLVFDGKSGKKKY